MGQPPNVETRTEDFTSQGDCNRCQGLCCVALAFDRGEDFSFSKPAGVPCRHLNANYRCGLHAERHDAGLRGCVQYDCGGAGQQVTEQVFPKWTWRAGGPQATAMFDAFRALRRIKELRLLLATAERLPLSPEQQQQCRALERQLTPADGWTHGAVQAFEQSDTPGAVRNFLRGLRDVVPASALVRVKPSRPGR